MLLDRFFREREIATVELAPGITVPRVFSDRRAEHLNTRRAAGLFDFSFMSCFAISGPECLAYLNRLQVRNIALLPAGKIAYTLICREDGTIINDATVWCHGPDSYWIFTGRRSDRTHLEQVAADYRVSLTEYSNRHSVLALQGPRSLAILQQCFPGQAWASLPYYGFKSWKAAEQTLWVGRIGYAGELGYEIVVDSGNATALWQRLLKEGASAGLIECGFDSADSLRIEAGHILFSQELAIPATPFELGLERLLSPYGVNFIGAEALRAQRWVSPDRKLVGLLPKQGFEFVRGAPNLAEQILPCSGTCMGAAHITSQCVSPIQGRTLALGFVRFADRYPGTLVRLPSGSLAQVSRLPFYDPFRKLPRLAVSG